MDARSTRKAESPAATRARIADCDAAGASGLTCVSHQPVWTASASDAIAHHADATAQRSPVQRRRSPMAEMISHSPMNTPTATAACSANGHSVAGTPGVSRQKKAGQPRAQIRPIGPIQPSQRAIAV